MSWTPEARAARLVVLAVADGHGSATAVRSDVGSRLAVSTGESIVRSFFDSIQPDISAADLLAKAKEYLPGEIVRRWTAAVEEDLAAKPLLSQELERAASRQRAGGTEGSLQERPLLAYGATLLVVAATPRFVVAAQIGDGDVLSVPPSGPATRPVPGDPRLIANETTSLCLPTAERDFRVTVIDLDVHPIELLIISTDGYANSFKDDRGFLKVGEDLRDLLREHGPSWVHERLPGWLDEASRIGSGDDTTAGIVYRLRSADETHGRWRTSPRSVQDPASAAPVASGEGPEGSSAEGSASSRPDIATSRPWRLVVASLVGLLAGGLIGALVFHRPSGSGPVFVADAGSLVRLDASGTHRVMTPWLPAGVTMAGAVSADGHVWVALSGGALLQLDEQAASRQTTVSLPGPIAGLVLRRDELWALAAGGRRFYVVNPLTHHVRAVPIPGARGTPTQPPSPTASATAVSTASGPSSGGTSSGPTSVSS